MRKKLSPKNLSLSKNSVLMVFVTAAVYACFAFYLYHPHFKNFTKIQYLLVINPLLAGVGCYLLSRRWIVAYSPSMIAGAVYGFGPFMLGLGMYHPLAGLLYAALPWLFLPAAFAFKGRLSWLGAVLALVPFAVVIIFFQLAARLGLFPIPTRVNLSLSDFFSLIAPLVMVNRNANLIGFYHIPVAPLIIGFAMLLRARRMGTVIIFSTGLILACCKSFLGVSPLIWLSVPTLCCCVLIGVGCQAVISAGFADRKWFLGTSIIMLITAVAILLLGTKYAYIFAGLGAGYVRLFTQTAKMYILAALTMAGVFILTRSSLRLTMLRQITFCGVIGLDIFFSARFIVDHIL